MLRLNWPALRGRHTLSEAREFGDFGMPYLYIPPLGKRVFKMFYLRRWCWRCQDWVRLVHIHYLHDWWDSRR